MRRIGRRSLLIALGSLATATLAGARVIFGGRPFNRERTPPPTPVDRLAGWTFFTNPEAQAVETIVERLIPTDELGLGGRDAGCAVFIDRQLAGAYGRSETWYLAGPRRAGTPQQGPQYTDTIATRVRKGLAALDAHCRKAHGGRFCDLPAAGQIGILSGMERGEVDLGDVPSAELFARLLKMTREGYLADPLYGGNKDLAGWRMIGFPGARYDYRAEIVRRGEDLQLAPVAIYSNATSKGRS